MAWPNPLAFYYRLVNDLVTVVAGSFTTAYSSKVDTRASRDLLLAVMRAHHEIFMVTNERAESALSSLRLTPQTAQALWAIDPNGAPPSMSSIAAALHCNASNLTFIAKQLESRGYVTRERDAADRRSHVLVLTTEGEVAREAVVDAMVSITPFAESSQADLRELSRLLSRISV